MPANIDQRIYKRIRDPKLEERLKNLYPEAVANSAQIPVEEAQAVDEQGFVPGTNVMPREVQEKAPKNPLDELQRTEPTTFETQEMVEQEPVGQSYNTGMPGFDRYTAGFKMGQEALAAKGAAESEKANALLDVQQKNDEILKAREMEMEEKRRADEEYLAGERRKIEAKQEEYNAKPANIAQMFQEKSTGGKIAMGIALFLGSAPNSTGQNKAVQVLSESIKQDLDKQMNELTGQRGIYNDIKGEFADKEQARQAAYEMTMRQLQRQLGIEGAKYTNAEIQANMKAGQAQLKQQEMAARANFDQASMQNMMKAQEMNMKQREMYVPGLGIAPNKKVRDELFEIKGSVAEATGIIDDLLTQSEKGSKFSMKDRAKAAQNVNSLVGKMRIAVVGPGPLTEPEREFIKSMIGNPLKFIGLKSLETTKLNELKRIMNKSLNAKATAWGMSPPTSIEDQAKAL